MTPVFVILEGGGAKGVAHIGALRAVEQLGYPIAGIAGASAGSFVAALAAAGYRSDEMLDDKSKTSNLLSRKNLEPIDLLGKEPWGDMRRASRNATRLLFSVKYGGVAGAAILCPRSTYRLRRLIYQRGHFTTTKVRDFVNDCIRERLREVWAKEGHDVSNVPKHITFGDLDPGLFPELRPLKIIATDVDSGQGELFDRVYTPDVLIGDAVAASIAIPFVFQPARVRKRDQKDPSILAELPGRFVDGGLVSNLPSWVFNEERLALQRTIDGSHPIPILAFTLTDASAAGQPAIADKADSFRHFVTRVARSAIFGSQAVAGRLLADLDVIRLPTRLHLLAFDATWEEIREDYLAGRDHAMSQIRACLQKRPQLINDKLQQTLRQVREAIDAIRIAQGNAPVEHIRACLIEPYGQKSLRVFHGINMDNDADDRLALDREARLGAAAAMRSRDLQLLPIGYSGLAMMPMTKYEKALIRPSLKSALCIPVFNDLDPWTKQPTDRDAPLGVLSIDSDEDLSVEFKDQSVQKVAVLQSVLLSIAFQRN